MTKLKNYRRDRIRKRIRKIISGSSEYPRLSIFIIKSMRSVKVPKIKIFDSSKCQHTSICKRRENHLLMREIEKVFVRFDRSFEV